MKFLALATTIVCLLLLSTESKGQSSYSWNSSQQNGNGAKVSRAQNWAPNPGTVFGGSSSDTYTINQGDYVEIDQAITLNCTLIVNGTLRGNNNAPLTISNGGVLIINGTGTMQQNASIVVDSGASLNNNGRFEATGSVTISGSFNNSDSAELIVDASGGNNGNITIDSSGSFNNQGNVAIEGGGEVTNEGGTITNTGNISNTGGTFYSSATFRLDRELAAGAYYDSLKVVDGAKITFNGSARLEYLNLDSGTLVIASDTLFLNTFIGMSPTNRIAGNRQGSIQFDGAQTATLFLSHDSIGYSNELKHFILNNASANITLGNATEISGVLTPTNGSLTTAGNLTLASTGQSAYAQVATGSGTISGNVTYQMYMVGGYQQVGTAVATTIQDFAETGNYLAGSVFSWNNASSSWVTVDSASNPSLTAGQGLFAFFGDAGGGFTYSFNTPGTLNLTGALHGGNYSANLTYHDGTGTNASFYQNGDSAGWNFLSNPYPSQLDWNQVTVPTNTNSAIYIYKASDGTYTAYSQGAGSGTNGGTQYIAPMQGFFVQVTAASSGESINFTNAQRTVQNTATPTFFKNGAPEQIHLEIESSADGKKDETIIQFNTASTEGFDGKFDAVKFFNGGTNPNIYTSDSIGKTYSINCLPIFDSNYSHPIAFKLINTTGSEFTLRIAKKQSMEGWRIYLEDTYKNTYHELHNGEYTFTVDDKNQDLQDRFIVHYVKAEKHTGFMKAVAASAFKIYQTPQTVHLDVKDKVVDVEIVDLMGRVVTPSVVYQTGNHEIKLPTNGHTQIYIIRVSNDKETQSLKVIR